MEAVRDLNLPDRSTNNELSEDQVVGPRQRTLTDRGREYELDVKAKKMSHLVKQLKAKYTVIEQLVNDVEFGALKNEHKSFLILYEDYLQVFSYYLNLSPGIEDLFEDRHNLLKMYKDKIDSWVLMSSKSVITPRDSASEASKPKSQGETSNRSRQSSVISAKLKASQRKAELHVRLDALGSKRKLEEAKLQIEQAKLQLQIEEQELELKTEIVIADAQYKILDELGESGSYVQQSNYAEQTEKKDLVLCHKDCEGLDYCLFVNDHTNVHDNDCTPSCLQRVKSEHTMTYITPNRDTARHRIEPPRTNLQAATHLAHTYSHSSTQSTQQTTPHPRQDTSTHHMTSHPRQGISTRHMTSHPHQDTSTRHMTSHPRQDTSTHHMTSHPQQTSMTSHLHTDLPRQFSSTPTHITGHIPNMMSTHVPKTGIDDSIIRQLRKPVSEIKKFEGDPLEFCKFMRQFKSKIVQYTDDDDERLNYLIQFTDKKPQEIVSGYAYLDAKVGYPAALNDLQQRYGQDDVLAEAFIKKALGWPAIKPDNPAALDEFAIFLSECGYAIQSIEAVRVLEYAENMKKLVSKLPFNYHDRWRNIVYQLKQQYLTVRFHDLVNFVNTEAKKACDPTYGRDAMKSIDRFGIVRLNTVRRSPRQSTVKGSYATKMSDAECPSTQRTPHDPQSHDTHRCLYCSAPSHDIDTCESFLKRKHTDKIDFLKKKGVCFGCLKHGHMKKHCKSKSICNICNYRHPTILHDDNWTRNKSTSTHAYSHTDTQNTTILGKTSNQAGYDTEAGEGECTLAVIPVRVKLKNGLKSIITYAFLDPGSNVSFCTDKLLHELHGHGRKKRIKLTTMGEPHIMETTAVANLQVTDLQSNNVIDLPRVYTKEKMPISQEHIPNADDVSRWSHLSDIRLPKINAEIGLLIGNNVPDAYTPMLLRTGPRGSPHATKSLLGWIVWNAVREDKSTNSKDSMISANGAEMMAINEVEELRNLDVLMEKSINLEFPERTIDDRRENSQEDKQFLSQVESSLEMKDGHYYMNLPFKKDHKCMPNNESQALKRFSSLTQKMKRNPDFKKDYIKFVDEILEKGYAEKVSEDDLPGRNGHLWYLPHHGVYHPRKPGKLRVVFDCSATYLGNSLNRSLLQGPDLTNSLLAVLMRFRQDKIAVMGDIEAMYHQVRVHKGDCDYLRFFWWTDGNVDKEPEIYRMKVHIFGAVSSPSCANFALKHTATDNHENYPPEILEGVNKNFYVDDYLASKPTVNEATSVVNDTTAICKEGGFKLTKWVSNSHEVLMSVPAEERSKEVKLLDLKQDVLPSERALGVYWMTESDMFGFKLGNRQVPCTRRGILSLSSTVYDPFGFTAPFVLIPKHILQELCTLGIGWDDEIGQRQLKQWNKWVSELELLEDLKVNRCYKPKDFKRVIRCELHNFADASETGYGMVSYLRLEDEEGRIHCAFVMGKARVAPLKKVTIPRLELTAATALVRINKMLVQELDYTIDKSYYWTDSMSVLRYIANETCRFHTFVANRISVIREGSTVDQWGYVKSCSNPADIASRGMPMKLLLQTPMWFCGPDFLWKSKEEWPQMDTPDNTYLVDDPEVKHVFTTIRTNDDVMDRFFDRFSDWMMMKKVTGWLLTAAHNLKTANSLKRENKEEFFEPKQSHAAKNSDRICLSLPMLEKAEYALVQYVQRKHFGNEIEILRDETSDQKIPKSSSLAKLDPFLSEETLRVGGRLDKSTLSYEAKHPVVLPKYSPVSRLILKDAHQKVGHLGKNAILAHIRQRYWILGANGLIKSMLAKCVTCRRYQGSASTQKMASLPSVRVTSNEPPFSRVGIDYFGPFEVKRGRSLVKRWGVLFTCLKIRAVHLEVAASLDTDSCISAIRRFVARRGPVRVIKTDNGTNFTGAERELREAVQNLDSKKIQSALFTHNIAWEFNPPAASNFGGVWERLIRLVRKVMYSILHTQIIHLDDEGLHTLFCEVEAILNGRPISEMSNSPHDFDALTPNHLLLFRGGEQLPPGTFDKGDNYCQRRWRQLQYLADLFWKRWTRQYLPLLQEKQKWQNTQKNLNVGDIVLIMDNTPRNSWSMGRVLETIQDKRGLVRIVKLRTKTSTLLRPVNKLCLLLENDLTQ